MYLVGVFNVLEEVDSCSFAKDGVETIVLLLLEDVDIFALKLP